MYKLRLLGYEFQKITKKNLHKMTFIKIRINYVFLLIIISERIGKCFVLSKCNKFDIGVTKGLFS